VRSRGAFLFYALLRGLAYSAALSACPKPARRGERRANAPRSRKLSEFGASARDNDDLAFDFRYEVAFRLLLSNIRFHFPTISFPSRERSISIFLVPIVSSDPYFDSNASPLRKRSA